MRDTEDIRPKLISTGDDYVSIGYGSRFLLRLYRKVDLSINPDAEMTYFLSDVANYPYVPALPGSVAMLAAGESTCSVLWRQWHHTLLYNTPDHVPQSREQNI